MSVLYYRADECGPVYVFWVYIRSVVVAAHPDVNKVEEPLVVQK